MTEGHGGWSGPEWTEPGGEPGGGLDDPGFTDLGHEHGLLHDDLSDPHGHADAEHLAGHGGAGEHPDGASDEADHPADPAHPVGPDPAHPAEPGHPGQPTEPADRADAEPAESVVDGPEPVPHGAESPFPPALDLDVTPADGQPWVDPSLLGADHDPGPPLAEPTDPPAALLADLHAADGGGDEPASAASLAASDDPAIRALAAYWSR